MKARCEFGVEKCYPSGKKRRIIRYKIDERRIGRTSKSVSCLGKNNWSPEECVEVHTRRKVERIKRKGEQEQNWYLTNWLGNYWSHEMLVPSYRMDKQRSWNVNRQHSLHTYGETLLNKGYLTQSTKHKGSTQK
jgi:hypothetical protein